jgi:hypothetical protein
MTIRRFPSSQSPDSDVSFVRSIPWISLSVVLSAVSMCGAVFAFVSVQPSQALSGAGWLVGAKGASLSEAFGAAPTSAETMRHPAKFLSGIGGQTFSPGARQNALTEVGLQEIAPNIAPVAWDRLSAGDCITVTSKSGQTFSFRIVGARSVGKSEQADNLPRIELAVSGCADMGEPVAKAVIQPTNPPAPKAENAARSL